ncbi:MAG TPA: LacI family DNA-binding transcriptional regulator [Rhodanobacteraceae bacterium]
MTSKGKSTSIDIAYRAGVSQATVSRALRDSPLVSEETRRKVQAAARELNYKVDKNASSLRTQKSGTLALLFFEDPTSDDSHINPFFVAMLGSITRACAQRGFDLLISFQQGSEDWHAEYADSHKADGLILLGYGDYVAYCEKARKLVDQGTRFVRWGASLPDQPDVSVGCDNAGGGYAVTRHLLAQGCRHIAFLGTASQHAPEFFGRYRGYVKALAEHGIAPQAQLQADAESTQQSGYEAMHAVLAHGQPCDGVFAASDLIALGAMRALGEQGLAIPADVAVAGFDDVPMASFAHPPLTTARQDTTRAGSLLVERLLQLIDGETVAAATLPIELVVRPSSQRVS